MKVKRPNKAAFFWTDSIEIFKQVAGVLAQNPMITVLFLILGLLDFAALGALFMAHSEPLSNILGPVIRRFYGERFLHYPQNFILLPTLFKHAHTLILASAGLFFSGLVIIKIEAHVMERKDDTLFGACGVVAKKYGALLLAWVAAFLTAKYAGKLLFSVVPSATFAGRFALIFVFVMLTQALFAFLIPAILVSGKKFLAAVLDALSMAVKKIVSLLVILAIPMFFAVILSFAKSLAPDLVRFNPELVLVVLSVSIVVTVIIDLFVTMATAILYIRERKPLS